jgi:putative iron-regulated protein
MRPCNISMTLVLAIGATGAFAQDRGAVVATYADIAEAAYSDSLITAEALQSAVKTLIAMPSEESLVDARSAWLAARAPYMQTEVYRFGNPIVDDWEGKLNAWPLDEGLIDYVASGYFGSQENDQAELNVIANPEFMLSGKEVDAREITADLLANVLQEADQNEANVATGYHAIEFLLWGQDLISDAPAAGQRPYTDFVQGTGCTGGNCDRRAQYLAVATELLVSDLEWMVAQWGKTGPARLAVTDNPDLGVAAILTGIGNLSYGEMAGQRVKLGLILHDPEEEHDCFSDNTPASHHFDVLGMQNVYTGTYRRVDGTVISGPSLQNIVAEKDPVLAKALDAELNTTLASTQALRDAAAAGMSYDMMLQVGNAKGEAMITAVVDNLVAQSRSVERISSVLDLSGVVLEGDSTLDTAGEVFK